MYVGASDSGDHTAVIKVVGAPIRGRRAGPKKGRHPTITV